MRCRIEVLPDDDPRDGEYEFIEPCDDHRDLAPTGVFHRTEMWKHLSLAELVGIGRYVNESMKRVSPDTPRVLRTFEIEGFAVFESNDGTRFWED